MIIVRGVVCNNCNDFVFSRVRYDYHSCSCGQIGIDGGFDYMRITGLPDEGNIIKKRINATRQELYDDWNTSTDKFGRISDNNKNRDTAKKTKETNKKKH